jgi:hypothetical protein
VSWRRVASFISSASFRWRVPLLAGHCDLRRQRSLEDSVCVRDANTSYITKRLAINSAGCPGSTPRFDPLVSFLALVEYAWHLVHILQHRLGFGKLCFSSVIRRDDGCFVTIHDALRNLRKEFVTESALRSAARKSRSIASRRSSSFERNFSSESFLSQLSTV